MDRTKTNLCRKGNKGGCTEIYDILSYFTLYTNIARRNPVLLNELKL